MGKQHRIAPDVKEQILRRIRDDGITASQAAEEHGVKVNTVYTWLTKKVSNQPTHSEFNKLKKQNKMLMELVGELTVKLSAAQKKK